MPERRTQSYAAVRSVAVETSDGRTLLADPHDIPAGKATAVLVERGGMYVAIDPEDFELELPPSPTFWPRDEPKEPKR